MGWDGHQPVIPGACLVPQAQRPTTSLSLPSEPQERVSRQNKIRAGEQITGLAGKAPSHAGFPTIMTTGEMSAYRISPLGSAAWFWSRQGAAQNYTAPRGEPMPRFREGFNSSSTSPAKAKRARGSDT